MKWTSDKSGRAGILTLAPYLEVDLDEVWDFDDYLDAAAKLREMLIVGDLRALYVLWMCSALSSSDDDEAIMEPTVPHGLGDLPNPAADLLVFFETDPLLVDAAAIGIPTFNAKSSQFDSVNVWLTTITDSRQNEIIQRLLAEDPVALKAELLSDIRDSLQAPNWPVEPPTRTVAQLLENCELLRTKADEKQKQQAAAKAKREADKAEKQRQVRMIEMQSAPDTWLKKASTSPSRSHRIVATETIGDTRCADRFELFSAYLMTPHRCAIYTRQSRSSSREFTSCDAQYKVCFVFAASMQRQGWQLFERRYDDVGRSSETLDRPALNRLIEDIQAGNIDLVLVHRLDRIARKIL